MTDLLPAATSVARSHTHPITLHPTAGAAGHSPSLLTRPLHLTPASLTRMLAAMQTSSGGINALPPPHSKSLHPPQAARVLSRPAALTNLFGSLTSRDFGLVIIALVLLGLVLHFGLLFYLVVRLKGGDSTSTSGSGNTATVELHAATNVEAMATMSARFTQASSAGTVGGDRAELTNTLTGAAFGRRAQQTEAVGIATLATIVATPAAPITVELAPAASDSSTSLKRVLQVRETSSNLASLISLDSDKVLATYAAWLSVGGAPVTSHTHEPLSIVYSWCNGSDPRFTDVRSSYAALKPAKPSATNTARANQARLASQQAALQSTARRVGVDPDVNRFRQFDELRYSIRSVYKHAHKERVDIRNIFLLVHDCLEPASADGTASQACMPKQLNANGVLPETFAAHRTNPEDRTQGDMQIPEWLDTESPALGLSKQHAAAAQLIATDDASEVAASTPSGGIRFGLVPHSQVFSHEDPSQTASALAARLPTFNSFSIESRLVSLRTQLPSLTRRFIYLNDDMMFGSDLHEAHFYSPQYGLVIYAEDLLVGVNVQLDRDNSEDMPPPSLDKGKGEWAALDFTNVLLSRRFGRRSRAYISHYAHVMDKDLLHEMSLDPILRLELDRSAGHRFRGDAWEVHLPFLFAHYVMERSRETLLRAYIQGRLDANHDGFIDEDERADLIQTLAAYDHTVAQCTPSMRTTTGAPCSTRNTLVHDDVKNHPGSKYLFSSLDGFGYSRKDYTPPPPRQPLRPGQRAPPASVNGPDSALFTPTTPATARCCSFVPSTCFGQLWNNKLMRADEALHALAHNNLQCGDCLLTVLVQQSGAAGLSALLPKEDTAQVNACHNPQAPQGGDSPLEYDMVADPFFAGLRPSGASTDATSRSHAVVSDRPVCPSSPTFNWRLSSLRVIHRYQHVMASAVGMFMQMGSLISPFEVNKVVAKIDREHPTFICVNDDGLNTVADAQRAQTNFKTVMQSRYATPSPIEQQP